MSLLYLFSLCAKRFCPEMIPVKFLMFDLRWFASFGGLFLRYARSNSLFSCLIFVEVIFLFLSFSIFDFSISLMVFLGRYRKGSGPICLVLAPFLARVSASSFPAIPMWALTLCSVMFWDLLSSLRFSMVSSVNFEFDEGLFSFWREFCESVKIFMLFP